MILRKNISFNISFLISHRNRQLYRLKSRLDTHRRYLGFDILILEFTVITFVCYSFRHSLAKWIFKMKKRDLNSIEWHQFDSKLKRTISTLSNFVSKSSTILFLIPFWYAPRIKVFRFPLSLLLSNQVSPILPSKSNKMIVWKKRFKFCNTIDMHYSDSKRKRFSTFPLN